MISRVKPDGIDLPSASYFDLPEKVLQFGTGVLLRGLPDYFIDKANKKGLFNGRIVLVKSTTTGETELFRQQDGLYTTCIRGLVNGVKQEENIINASISRLLSAKNDWNEILTCATNPQLEIVISNTTEIGIQLIQDHIDAAPPESFPGKLLAILYKRFLFFNGDPGKGMVIIPTELIPRNGERLREVLLELAEQNSLEKDFCQWLQTANYFCNSLVDRIVPGKLPPEQQTGMEEKLGYEDGLMIMAEPYCLWAIESDNRKVRDILSFSLSDPGVVIAPDITIFRELKLRLLNGSHTFTCGLAYLRGFATVRDAMENDAFSNYIRSLMFQEIIPSITNEKLSVEAAGVFGEQVLDRYRNPFINHLWLSITLQYSSKMRLRNVPILLNYFERFGRIPAYMSLGFAAHLWFMKSVREQSGQYYGEANGKAYLVNDDHADFYAQCWKQPYRVVNDVLSHRAFWGTDLSKLPGFADAVSDKLNLLMSEGVAESLKNIQSSK